MVITSLDFDHRFVIKDFLAKRSTQSEVVLSLLGSAVLAFLYFGFYLILPYLGFIYNLLKIIYYLRSSPFQSKQIQSIEFSLTVTNIYISIIFILRQLSSKDEDFIILLLCSTPLSFFAGKKIYELRLHSVLSHYQTAKNSIFSEEDILSEKQLEKLDFYLRSIYQQIDCSLIQYITSHLSFVLDQIVVLHHQTCTQYPNCFCSEYVIPSLEFMIKN